MNRRVDPGNILLWLSAKFQKVIREKVMGEIFKTRIDVRFRDLDANGHVNHVVFFTYFEEGRKAFFLDLSKISGPFLFPFIMAHISCDYLLPIGLEGKLALRMWVDNIGTKSFSLNYKLLDLQDESKVYAKGESVQVCYDYVQGESIEIPPHLRETLERIYMAES